MWSFHGSAVVGTSIFLFLTPNIVLVPIFVENGTFLNFSVVGRGCGRSTGRQLSGHTFSDLSYRIQSRMMSYERQWLIFCKLIVCCVSFHFMKPLPLPCQKYAKKKRLKWGLCAFLSLLLLLLSVLSYSVEVKRKFKIRAEYTPPHMPVKKAQLLIKDGEFPIALESPRSTFSLVLYLYICSS